jgi:hypothetical protein
VTTPSLPPQYAAMMYIRSGVSGREALADFRATGGQISDRAFYNIYQQAQSANERRATSAAKDIDVAPVASDYSQFTTRHATGMLHQITVFLQDTETGDVTAKEFSVVNRPDYTRRQAMAEAMDTANPEKSGSDTDVVIGASYVGTYSMVPR